MFTRNSQLATAESRKHIELVLKVARMYYMQNLTQAQIASAVGYSRPTVSRLLQESRDEGIVHIDIGHVLERVMSLEDRLVQRFRIEIRQGGTHIPDTRPG